MSLTQHTAALPVKPSACASRPDPPHWSSRRAAEPRSSAESEPPRILWAYPSPDPAPAVSTYLQPAGPLPGEGGSRCLMWRDLWCATTGLPRHLHPCPALQLLALHHRPPPPPAFIPCAQAATRRHFGANRYAVHVDQVINFFIPGDLHDPCKTLLLRPTHLATGAIFLNAQGLCGQALDQAVRDQQEHTVDGVAPEHYLCSQQHQFIKGGRAKQLMVFFGAATIGTRGGWGADAVLRACCKVVCRTRGTDKRRSRVVLVDEHSTSRVSSAVNGQQPCERQLNKRRATRPAGWKPPAGQVHHRLVRPAWSQLRDQPVRGMMWCPLPAKGKEYPGLGYKRVRDKPPKTQPAAAQ
ncbi:hypothetical protein HaLaN_29027 [Haematococcus lacustris]|uniref:Uncharacterized protein n=1 Tax=Haematococcus lacustris TaxID=44745 RepID=A0A6A0AD74_HAELA|nr:hypothetical protein HaLaN_29027 [Haematococcus lacustris]